MFELLLVIHFASSANFGFLDDQLGSDLFSDYLIKALSKNKRIVKHEYIIFYEKVAIIFITL